MKIEFRCRVILDQSQDADIVKKYHDDAAWMPQGISTVTAMFEKRAEMMLDAFYLPSDNVNFVIGDMASVMGAQKVREEQT